MCNLAIVRCSSSWVTSFRQSTRFYFSFVYFMFFSDHEDEGVFYVKYEQEPTGSGYNTLQSNNSFSLCSSFVIIYSIRSFVLHTNYCGPCRATVFGFDSFEFLICLCWHTCTVYITSGPKWLCLPISVRSLSSVLSCTQRWRRNV